MQVFRGYYLAKIQGELLEVNIRQAWDDLHYGTGKSGNAVPCSTENLRHKGKHYSNREFRKKEMKTEQKMLRRWCSWRVLPGFGNL